MQNTRLVFEQKFKKLLNETKGFKFNETVKVQFNKTTHDSILFKTAYFNSKSKTINGELQFPEQEILNKIAVWVSEGSGWTIKSIDNHFINLVNYKPLRGLSYIQLPIELRNSSKGLINMKNEDNNCFRWCHVRYMNPQEKDSQRIKKSDKEYIQKLNYNNIEFPVAVKQYNKIKIQNNININVFGFEKKTSVSYFHIERKV